MGMNPAQAQASFDQLVGRTGGPEYMTSGTWVPAQGGTQTIRLPQKVNLNRPLFAIYVILRFRLVVANANYNPVAAESPQNLLQRLRVFGQHTKRGNMTPIDISGTYAFARPQVMGPWTNKRYIGTATYTLIADPSVPFTMAAATFGNIGTYDVECHYLVPVTPLVDLATRAKRTVSYLWRPEDWGDSLQIELSLGDSSAFGTNANFAANTTMTAYGGATGSPTYYVYNVYSLLGDLRGRIPSSILVQNELSQYGGGIAAIANYVKLWDLQHQDTLNIVLKSGVNLTGLGAGVQSFSTLSDSLVDNLVLLSDNKRLRNALNNFAAKGWAGHGNNTILPGGYVNLTAVDSQTPATAFEFSKIPSPTQLALYGDIASASANNGLSLVQEYTIPGS